MDTPTFGEVLASKFAFLSSTRFWAIVIGAVSFYAQTKGFIGEPEMVLIATIMGGFTVVRTVDRLGDAKVEAAVVAAEVTGV